MQRYTQKLVFFLLLRLIFWETPALGQKSPKSQIKKSPRSDEINRLPMRDFMTCQKKALSDAKKKSKSLQTRYFRASMKVCKDQFPAYPAFRTCKKNVLKTSKKNKKRLKAGLRKCRQDYLSLTFDPDNSLSFKVKSGQLFFAGLGLNLPIQISKQKKKDESEPKSRRFGNFDCQRLESAMTDDTKIEYLLFGNAVRSFKDMSKLPDSRIMEFFNKDQAVAPIGKEDTASQKTAESKENIEEAGTEDRDEIETEEAIDEEIGLGEEQLELEVAETEEKPAVLIDGEWGQIAINTRYEELSNFFPTSYCQFNSELGELFEDIKVYYLISRQKKLALPYFGVAFYQQNSRVSAASLIQKVKAELGDGFEEQMSGRGLTFIANSGFLKFDEDGEPFDLCREPRRHYRIATVARYPNSPHASYLLLSNVHNLCTYGDRLAGVLSREVSQPSNERKAQDKK